MKSAVVFLLLVVVVVLAGAERARAGETRGLLELLVRKGLITVEEAAEVSGELAAGELAVTGGGAGGEVEAAEAAEPGVVVATKATGLEKLEVSGRVQVQGVALRGGAAGGTSREVALRRVRLGLSGEWQGGWRGGVVYDFESEQLDRAVVGWEGETGAGPMLVEAGWRRVDMGREENTSSGRLAAIERSGVTNFFMGTNNGRRLGAGAYRTGVFAEINPGAKRGAGRGWFAGAAITEPERADGAAVAGNELAGWAHAGWAGGDGASGRTVRGGVAGGVLPEQGGRLPGTGADLRVASGWVEVGVGRFGLVAEVLGAEVEAGARSGGTARPWGFWVQPSWRWTERLETVVRYSFTDADGRGIRAGDGIRGSQAGMEGDTLSELYSGINYNLRGPDLRWQLGFVLGRVEQEAGGHETTQGVRSQVQVQF